MEASDVRRVLQAAERGDKKVLQKFLSEQERNVGVVDEDGNTPLMVAAASGREEVLRLLLDQEVRYIPIYPHILSK